MRDKQIIETSWFQNFCQSDLCLTDQQRCRKAITSLQSCARLKGDVEVRIGYEEKEKWSQLGIFSRWARRMCTRYLGWFLSVTLRGSLKFASSTPMRGFRYFVERSLMLFFTVFPPRSTLTSWCVKASLDTSWSANFTTTRFVAKLISPMQPCPGGECLLERPAEVCYCWTPCCCWALSARGGWRVPPGKTCLWEILLFCLLNLATYMLCRWWLWPLPWWKRWPWAKDRGGGGGGKQRFIGDT